MIGIFNFSYKRAVAAHVDMESESWQIGLSLAMELESVSKNFVSHALYDMKECDDTIPADAEVDNGSFTLPLPKPHELKLALSSPTIAVHETPSFSNSEIEKSGESMQILPDTLSAKLRLKVVSSITDKVMMKIHEWCLEQGRLERGQRRLFRYEDFAQVGYVLSGNLAVPTPSTLQLWDFYLTAPMNSATSFKVSSDSVSIHIPLHRLVAKVIQCAAFSNVDLSSVIEYWRHKAPVSDHQRMTMYVCFSDANMCVR